MSTGHRAGRRGVPAWPEIGSSATGPSGSDEPVARLVERLLQEFHPNDRVQIAGAPVVPLPEHVMEAALAAMKVPGYAPSSGEPVLRQAIQESLRREGIRVGAGRVLVTNGAMHALDIAFRSVLSPGDEVLMARPGFFIEGLVNRAGGVLRTFNSPEQEGFRPDWDHARASLTPRTRLLYINSPVNPTGYMFSESDIEAALSLAEEADLRIVSDESLAHFVFGGRRHQSPLAFDRGPARTVLIRSFSKDFAMPGWRVGYLVAPPDLISPLTSMLEWSVLSVNRAAQAAASAALTGPQEWIDEFLKRAEVSGDRLSSAMASLPELRCQAPDGGLNVFPGFAGDAQRFSRRLVVEFGVPACPGEAFGVPGHFRLQFGGREGALEVAIDRIKAALTTS
jgi:aspartate/methionine/tyrosine aminotransferase